MTPSTNVQATVKLDAAELARVKAFSERIHAANRRRGRRHAQGWKPKGREAVNARYLGYCAEFAFAKFLGVEWHDFGIDADHWRARPDVGGYDVKSTDLVFGRLIVTPRDDDERRCVLVICRDPFFDVCGYYRAGDAKRPEWWSVERAKGGAWYVPRDQMRDVPVFIPPADPSAVVDAAVEAHKTVIRSILDDARAFDEAQSKALERSIVERIESLGPVERGDWRAVLRAKGIEPPEANRDDERQR